ncbi:ROK family protein [Marinomonas sp. M1K-6]|uniref:ROK family protein n=1 Tax=Marinomonas profundi TaxID=2726122 RepID=A0A847R459_9GAMM|nr:ROK family transcriptional regulator [Marinomonas profundi]NLQ18761.1 ROK family protein [Marinomonas profundi]UDV03993.1 ROK family protein [Marinomonas profundi]
MPTPIAHKPSSLAINTDRAFIGCLLEHKALSRAAIASLTGISKPTVSESAQRLLARQVIVECTSKDTQSSKRPSVLYELNRQRGASLAIGLDDVSTQLCLWDLQGNERLSRHLLYPEKRSAATYIKDLLNAIRELIETAKLPLLSIGLSIADPIHPKDGTVVKMPNSPFPVAQEIDFIKQLETVFQCSVVIDNDVNWATLSEQKTSELNNFIYVFLGRGIGCGLFFEHTLIRGHNGMAGEIGYVTLHTGKTLLEGIYDDSFYENTLKQPAQIPSSHMSLIAQAIQSTAQITHPEAIVLGGPLANNPLLQSYMVKALAQTLPSSVVCMSQAPDNAPLYGAAQAAHVLMLVSLGIVNAEEGCAQFGFHKIHFDLLDD